MEKLSHKESVEVADAVVRGSLRAPEGFSKGKPNAAKPRGRSPQGFAAEGLPEENPGLRYSKRSILKEWHFPDLIGVLHVVTMRIEVY